MAFKFIVDNFFCLPLGHSSGADLGQSFHHGGESVPFLQLHGLSLRVEAV